MHSHLHYTAFPEGLNGMLAWHLKAHLVASWQLLDALHAAADQETRVKAQDLYDPSNTLLAAVFEGQPLFPSPAYATPDWLKVRLGHKVALQPASVHLAHFLI